VRAEEIGHEAVAVGDSDGLLFVNVNTPDDHERARDLAEGKEEPEDRIMDAPICLTEPVA
jgi:hypothetical protein